jgi:hypothetical protein
MFLFLLNRANILRESDSNMMSNPKSLLNNPSASSFQGKKIKDCDINLVGGSTSENISISKKLHLISNM